MIRFKAGTYFGYSGFYQGIPSDSKQVFTKMIAYRNLVPLWESPAIEVINGSFVIEVPQELTKNWTPGRWMVEFQLYIDGKLITTEEYPVQVE